MSYEGWYSKKDVLKDLRKATGKRVLDIDERSVLVGEQPPPQRYNMLDEEAELQLLRLCGGCKPATEGVCTPDLVGITQMLRMVDGLSEEEPKQETLKPTRASKHIITKSVLNPEVGEFVPISSHIKHGTETKKETNSKKTAKTDTCDTLNLSQGGIDTHQLTEIEIKEMRDKLKTKISETSKAACVKVKRDRNMAIATLLKLYCQAPKPADEHIPKLISPAYFENSIEKLRIARNSTKQKEIETNTIEIHQTSTEKQQSDSITDDIKVKEPHISNIAASVDKVQKWLRDTENVEIKIEKPKLTMKVDDLNKKSDVNKTNGHFKQTDKMKGSMYLGAITFKRKACNSKPASPTSTDSAERRKPENGNVPKGAVYKPSPYAAELNKKYLERSKVQESLKEDFWAVVETKLKAKDEEIKNKQAKLEAPSENSIN
ncbi:uncharacterized protein LOC120629576 [Pararge aegeria]|uniref:uncharacterized protein LOC120629576 n=1 Tax=Pararge aegeria TaxID=116150 RepID=UPI0019CF7799|nr:uncharacterized protein LOC120629576 [Pararge aegeria]